MYIFIEHVINYYEQFFSHMMFTCQIIIVHFYIYLCYQIIV